MNGTDITKTEKVRTDLEKLRKDITEFASAYTPDSECWQGEAAMEERCYITADLDDLEQVIAKMESMITETEGSEERIDR